MGYMSLFQFWFPQGICLGVGLLAHAVVLFLVFSGTSLLFSLVLVSVYISTISERGCSFSPINPLQHVLFVDFQMMAILTSVR